MGKEREAGRALRLDRRLHRNAIIVLMAVIALVLTGWALKATGVIAAPLAFAFFLAILAEG